MLTSHTTSYMQTICSRVGTISQIIDYTFNGITVKSVTAPRSQIHFVIAYKTGGCMGELAKETCKVMCRLATDSSTDSEQIDLKPKPCKWYYVLYTFQFQATLRGAWDEPHLH